MFHSNNNIPPSLEYTSNIPHLKDDIVCMVVIVTQGAVVTQPLTVRLGDGGHHHVGSPGERQSHQPPHLGLLPWTGVTTRRERERERLPQMCLQQKAAQIR